MKYSFLQWASYFVTYLAAMASHDNNISHKCVYFNVNLKANEDILGACGHITMPTITRKPKPSRTRTGQPLTSHYSAAESHGELEKLKAVQIANQLNM